jgi:transposase-like protein
VKASRRSWPLEEKRRIVEEAFRPGTSVADVARRHGLNSNQCSFGGNCVGRNLRRRGFRLRHWHSPMHCPMHCPLARRMDFFRSA